MTDTLAIPEAETGALRLFAVDLPEADALAFAADPAAVARALGTDTLDPAYVDVFPTSKVATLGLSVFLADAHGIDPGDIAPHAARLDTLDGHVALIASGAFGGTARTLAVVPPLRHIGTFHEPGAPVTFGDLPEGGAAPQEAAPTPPTPPETVTRPRRKGRILTLLIFAVAILGVILLRGGQ